MVTVDANRVASSFWAPAPGVPLDPGSAGPETGDLLPNPGEQSAVSCSGPALAPSANPSGAPESPGLDLIRVSSLADETKARYSLAWRQWVAFFQERGVSPPGVTVPEALAWVRSRKWPPGSMHRHRYAVNHVYLAMGLPSPLQQPRVLREIFPGKDFDAWEGGYGGAAWPGFQLIQGSDLAPITKQQYAAVWREWVSFFDDQGVESLAVAGEQAQSWVRSHDWTPRNFHDGCLAINYVFRGMGLPSPFPELPHSGEVSGGKVTSASEMVPGGAGWAGCQLIEVSSLSDKTKAVYVSYWQDWVGYCQKEGLSPLGATVEEALGWVQSGDWTTRQLEEGRKAVNFVFRGMSLPSPLRPTAVMRRIFGGPAVAGRAALYGDAGWSGLEFIQASSLADSTKRRYSLEWRKWVAYFDEQGIAPLNVTVEEALDWVRSRKSGQLAEARPAVSFVFQGMGFSSPVRQAAVVREIRGGNGGGEAGGELCERVLAQRRLRVEDYLLWCQRNGKAALPGSGPQVADFLRFISDDHGYSAIKDTCLGVSRYLEDNGSASVTTHPAVRAARKECRARIDGRGDAGPREVSDGVDRVRSRYQSQWLDWCESESIGWQKATPADALRYLRGLEYQSSAWERVFQLSKLYEGMIDPFSDESVLKWKRWHIQAGRDGSLPQWRRGTAATEVIERIRSARFAARTVVPVGLTVEDLQGLDYEVSDRYSESTLRGYAAHWVWFESWLRSKEIPLDAVVGLHVAVFLKEYADGRRVGTVTNMLKALACVFDEFGFEDNPAFSLEVDEYIMKLTRQRKESQSQVSPFREHHYQAIVANAAREVADETLKGAQMRSALEPVAFGLMFDGMLRIEEAAEARWEDRSRHDDGSGMLLVPSSKTDQFGEGSYVYISRRTMVSLDRLREVQRTLGKPHSGSDRIFGLGPARLGTRLKEAAEAMGFEGRFGTHSMRVGMAQELAVAGFGLVLIMLAGRWENPGMPARYIRKLKLSEGAVARLSRAREAGLTRVKQNDRGCDVLATFDYVRFAL